MDVLLQDQFQLGHIRLAAVNFQLVETKMVQVACTKLNPKSNTKVAAMRKRRN